MIAKVVTGICCALIATLVLLGVALTAGRLNGAPTPALSSQVPNDVDMNSECKRKNECAFDEFSWESFVALNWAAVPGKRGRQDSAKPIWDKNRDKMAGDRMWVPAPRVWETWKADYELFQNRTAPAPSPWDSFDGQTPCKGPFDHRAKVLASFSMTGNFNQAGDGKPDGPLIAQNGTYVRFEVRINEPEFDYILEKGYYLANLLRKPKNNLWADFPTGSIGIKAAWRVVKESELEAARQRFYVGRAAMLDPKKGYCESQWVALVGLHIVHKTPSRRQWIWSSFEQVDNVDDGTTGQRKPPFSFNDGNHPVQEPGKALGPITKRNLPAEPTTPIMQIVRQKPISETIEQSNSVWRRRLRGTIWEHYQLVATNWPVDVFSPSRPENTGNPSPSGDDAKYTSTTNVTIETYFQGRTCMDCHQLANARGSDFVWFMTFQAFPQPETHDSPEPEVKTNRDAAMKELSRIIEDH